MFAQKPFSSVRKNFFLIFFCYDLVMTSRTFYDSYLGAAISRGEFYVCMPCIFG